MPTRTATRWTAGALAAIVSCVAAVVALAGATVNPSRGTNGTIVSFASFGFDPAGKRPKVTLFPVAGGKSVPMKVVSISTIRIDAQVAGGKAGSYTVRITPANKAIPPVDADGTFSIVVPEPAAVTPSSGPVKLPVVITGDMFGAARGKVTIGGKAAKVTRWANDRIEVVVPKKLAAGPHAVVVAGKSGTSTASLTYTVGDGGGGGDGEFMRVDVGATHLEQTARSQFYFSGTYNVSQAFAGATVAQPPGANPSFGFVVNQPAFATPTPFTVGTTPSATGTLTATYSDGAGSVYFAGSDMLLTVTGYADGLLAGTIAGSMTKLAGPGAATVTVTNGAFRVQLDIVGQ